MRMDGAGVGMGWSRDEARMGPVWRGDGVTVAADGPRRLPGTRRPSRPLGRHGGPRRLRGVLGEEPGATWVRGRLHGDANTRVLGRGGAAPPRHLQSAAPGAGHSGDWGFGLGVQHGPPPSKPPPGPSSVVWEQGQKGLGGLQR